MQGDISGCDDKPNARDIPLVVTPAFLDGDLIFIPIRVWCNVVEELEQLLGLLELPVLFLVEVGQLLLELLLDGSLELGEGVLGRRVPDWAALGGTMSGERKYNRTLCTYRAQSVHEYAQRLDLVVVHLLRDVQLAEQLTQCLLVILYVS